LRRPAALYSVGLRGIDEDGKAALFTKIESQVLEVVESLVQRVLAIDYVSQLAVEITELAPQRVDFVVKHLGCDARGVRT
jgi:hypothetical protein